MKEIWREIKGYEGLYEVSNKGRVRSMDRYVRHYRGGESLIKGTDRKLKITKQGYATVILSIDSVRKDYYVHRLVAEAFVKNTDNKPYINHIDGVKTNNHYLNLEWCTQSENQIHAFKNGLQKPKRGSECHYSKIKEIDISQILEMRKQGMLYKEIAECFGVHYNAISRLIKGLRWKHLELDLSNEFKNLKYKKGSYCGMAKLSESDIPKIIDMKKTGMSNSDIGKIFGVSRTTIGQILSRKTWTNVNICDSDLKDIGGYAKGSRSKIAKLTERDIPVIIEMRDRGMYYGEIGEKFGVSDTTISAIFKGKTWKHVTEGVL